MKEINRVLKPRGILSIRSPLLHPGFYMDFTHVKPYHPIAIMHYLRLELGKQRTMNDFSGFYKMLYLEYRIKKIFKENLGILNIFTIPFNYLYRIIKGYNQKTGYILIMKKGLNL